MTSQINPFQAYLQKQNLPPQEQAPQQTPQQTKENPFKIYAKENNLHPEDEGFLKSGIRTALQPVLGYLATTTPGIMASMFDILATGELYDPQGISELKLASEKAGIPFDEEKYMQAAETIRNYIPTVHNLARITEEKTDVPLEPKTRLQKGLRFATEAGRVAPSPGTFKGMATALPKPILGAGIEATSEVLQEVGLPEPLAQLLSFAILKQPPEGSPSINIGKSKKPSGLTERRFEKLEKPTEVSGKKIKKIDEKVENEFRDLASNIIEKSPIEETYSALKQDTGFKQAASEAFETVEQLSNQIPGKYETKKLFDKLIDNVAKNKHKGITPSEFDKTHMKFIKDFIKDTKANELSASQLVDQYRKNNKDLKQAYEPGQSFAYNRGKREALLDYNKAIADFIEQEFPKSEFSNLFKSTNKQWQQIMDAEAIDNFMDRMFQGKIRFERGKDFFEKEGMTVPFKRALGDEGFKDFKQLMKDLMEMEPARKMMQAAKANGYKQLAKNFGAYIIHPKFGIAKTVFDTSKILYKKTWEALLDKPQLAVTWDKGVQAFKKGRFAEAEKQFEILDAETKQIDFKTKQIDFKTNKLNHHNKNQ